MFITKKKHNKIVVEKDAPKMRSKYNIGDTVMNKIKIKKMSDADSKKIKNKLRAEQQLEDARVFFETTHDLFTEMIYRQRIREQRQRAERFWNRVAYSVMACMAIAFSIIVTAIITY
jgi:hypothetical protein